jgi:hypothetical protein
VKYFAAFEGNRLKPADGTGFDAVCGLAAARGRSLFPSVTWWEMQEGDSLVPFAALQPKAKRMHKED